LKNQKLSIRIHEVRNSKKAGSFVVGPALMTCQNFGISAYRRIGGREFVPKVLKPRVAIRSSEEFGISALRVSRYKGGSASGSEIAKC
jgi:hypothetical protein